MLTFIQMLGEADPNGLALIIFVIKLFAIGIIIVFLIIGCLLILLPVYLVYKLVTYFTRIKCKNCNKRIPKSNTNCTYSGYKMD